MLQERESSKGGLIGPRLFHGLVSAASTTAASSNNHAVSGISVVSDCIVSQEKPAKRQQLIPPQVLVPLSMKSSSSYSNYLSTEKREERSRLDIGIGSSSGINSLDFDIPEGRVHGGPLMSLFGGNLKNAIDGV